jgi:hypothetical protein
MRAELAIEEARFTDIDFLLNIGKVDSVVQILSSIRDQLRQVYAKMKETAAQHASTTSRSKLQLKYRK